MKKYFIFALLIFSLSAVAQNIDDCGLDNNPSLTLAEVQYLNNYFEEEVNNFDLKNAKILFITGNGGSTIGSKPVYFQHIKEWDKKNNGKIATYIITLNNEEKAKTGYDYIITYWVKSIISERKKQKIFSQLNNL